MFKETLIDTDFDGNPSSISLPTSPKSPIQVGIAVTDINRDDCRSQRSEWTESEESDDSSSSGGEMDSEDDPSTIHSASNSAPSHQVDFRPSTSSKLESQQISTKSDRADLGVLGRRRSGSSPSTTQTSASNPARKFSAPINKEPSQGSSPSSDYYSARSPSPLGPRSTPSSRPQLHRSPSIVLSNQRSPSMAMRHEVALRAFKSRTPPTRDCEDSSPSDEDFVSPVELQTPISAPLPLPFQNSIGSKQDFTESTPTPERPAAQIRQHSTPLLRASRRRNPKPNLAPLITPSPDQFSDNPNVQIIQDSSDEDGEVDKWQDEDDEKVSEEEEEKDEATEVKSQAATQPSSSRAAARKSLFSALSRDNSNSNSTAAPQVLPKPRPNTILASSGRRLPSLDQISSRVNQNQSQSGSSTFFNPSSPAPRGRPGQPVLSTPLPHQRSFSCPTPQTPLHQSFGSVEVFITPPTPRCPSAGKTDATMEVLRSPTNEAFAFVPAGTNEKNRMTLLETGSPLLTPGWNENGFGFGNSTSELIPPPFEIAPGRTKKMEERAKVMMEAMKREQETSSFPSSPLLKIQLVPGSPIPPKANQAMSIARDQASKYFAPKRRMASDPVGMGSKPSSNHQKQNKIGLGSGSDSPNWRSRGHIVPPLSSPVKRSRLPSNSSTHSAFSRRPAGNHSEALTGSTVKKQLEEYQSKGDSSIQIVVEDVSPGSDSVKHHSFAGGSSPPTAARSVASSTMMARLGQRKI